MQKISRDVLLEKAGSLLRDNTVSSVLGWRAGEFGYDVTPSLFTDVEDLNQNFVWNDFCGANFSKYLVKESRAAEGKVLVFLKPCDTYSFNQLLTEHRFDREKVYAVGIPCEGMLDVNRIKAVAGEGVVSIEETDDALLVTTLYEDAPVRVSYADALAERCQNCKSRRHVAYDEL